MASYNPYNRYRKRSQERVRRFFKGLSLFVVLMGIGFVLGREYNQGQATVYKRQLEKIEEERAAEQERMTDLQAEVQTVNARYNNLKQAYDEVHPDGPLGNLMNLVMEKMEEGIKTDYLTYVLRTAGSPRQCSEPSVKRFVLSTPTLKGPDSAISIANNAIKISGIGKSAHNQENEPEAWYDPTQKIAITFAPQDGVKQTKKAIMPFSHSIVVADKEYRFKIESGAKSFVKVTYDVCDYYLSDQ